MSQDPSPTPKDITRLLERWKRGETGAVDDLYDRVASDLRRLASRYLHRERSRHPLQTVDLVNEMFLRLFKGREVDWHDRAHFFGFAARIMRQVLIEEARKRKDRLFVTLTEKTPVPRDRDVDLIDLEDALGELAVLDERQSRVVELRYLTGMTVDETAVALGVSPATVRRDWTIARAWLFRRLEGRGSKA